MSLALILGIWGRALRIWTGKLREIKDRFGREVADQEAVLNRLGYESLLGRRTSGREWDGRLQGVVGRE